MKTTFAVSERVIVAFAITFIMAAFCVPEASARADSLRLDGAGLVSQNRFVEQIGGIPVAVVYLRGDFREDGQSYLWPRLEPEEGVYDFSPIVDGLNKAQEMGLKLGFRIVTAHPFVTRDDTTYPFFPKWIPYKEVTRDGRTAQAPDWDDPAVQQSIRRLLMALGDAVRDHPALLFVDVGVLGWVGEWNTTNGFQNADFMPTAENEKKYIDMHIDAFGADKLLLNLGAMEPEILDYGLAKGINGIRQDCFGSTYHMRKYELKLLTVPALQRVIDTGTVAFETCGIMQEWTNKLGDPNFVTLPIHEIFDVAIRWKTTLFSNLGAPIPDRFREEYMRLQRAMMTYVPKMSKIDD
ncbi:MAG: hypothetical protein WBW88_04690 [Rhodothermales bacterium]